MSSKNSAVSDTESEWDFYSTCWEEGTINTNKDLVDSGSESDLYLHPNSQHCLFEKQKGERKLGKAVLILENSKTNFTDCCKHCPLLQAQKIDNTREFQVELSPECVLHLNFKDSSTSGHSSKAYSSKISQSRCDESRHDFCLNCKIPHMFITVNPVTGKTFHSVKEAVFDKPNQKQPSVDYSPSSKRNKAVQVFFPCGKTEAGENFGSECCKQSSVRAAVNETSVKKTAIFHSVESQPADSHLGYSSNHSHKIDSPQTTEKIYFPTTSGELVISLTLEAAYLDPDTSLTGNIISSEVGKEDSQRHELAFKSEDSQQNQLFKKLCISIVPCPEQVDTGKHITPIKEVGCSDILDAETSEFSAVDADSPEASQPLAADTESAESSCSYFHSNQGLSTLKHWAPCQFFPLTKDTHANHSPHFCVRSFPDQHLEPKTSRCMKSVVFAKNKEAQKGKQFRNRHHISKFHLPKALNIEPISKSTQKTGEISELYYVPLTRATKCRCSPLLDLTADLYSSRRDSERLLSVHRKSHKRTGGGKVAPRFSFHCPLGPVSNLEKFHYISPVKRKNNMKMQNILNYCLGWTGQNIQKNSDGEVCPNPNSSRSPYLPGDGSLRNSSVPLSTAMPLSNERRDSSPCSHTGRSPAALYLLPKDQRQPSATCMQTGRDTWSPGTSYSYGRCNTSCFPCCENVVRVEQSQKGRNMFRNTDVERLDCGTNHMVSGGSAPKKPPACSCGNMPQGGLFPNGEISEFVKKTRTSPDTHWKASMTESDGMRSSMGSFITQDACCASCHHGLPPCCFCNTNEQGASGNRVVKVASFFENGIPPKNQKEDAVEKSKAMKTGERKNVRFHVGPGTLEMCSSGTHPPSPSNVGSEMLKHCHPECSCCRTATKEHFTTSGEGHCFGPEHKRLHHCLNRESIFSVNCGQGTRSQCKCSREISLFKIDCTEMHNGNRAAVSTQKDLDLQVCTSS